MSELMLENELLRLLLDPERGANLLAFYAKVNDNWLPIMPDARLDEVDLDAASFMMIPYSNRIENGIFTFEGKEYRLDNGENHAIHGDTRTRAWHVEASTEHEATFSFDSRRHPKVNWPWPFEARARYALIGRVLSAELTLWNRGDSAMPAGFGWHPYFSRALTRKGEPVEWHFQVAGVYPNANNNCIPSGPLQPLMAEQDFSTKRLLASTTFLDMCLHGYNGNGEIVWPESNVALKFRASEECSHLVLYNPAKPYFAVEPVTNANNGVNLYAKGDPTSGVAILQPDEQLHARFDLSVENNIIDNQ